jgi:hypothetical protein
LYELFASKLNTPLLESVAQVIEKLESSTHPVAQVKLYVNDPLFSQSSVQVNVQIVVQIISFSSILLQLNVISVGAKFALLIVTVNCFSVFNHPKSILLNLIE